MKRVLTILAVIAVFAPASLWAADVAKAEVFGGFSFDSIKVTGGDRSTAAGWQAALQGNMTEMFSIVGDFGGHYKDGGSALEYLGGPRITHRMDKTSVFAHALFGGTHFSDGGGNHFTMGYGGGLDVSVKDNFAIRVVQFDWAPIKADPEWVKNNIRFGFGVVWKSKAK